MEGLSPDSPVRSLVPEEKAGFLWRPDLSFDAEKIVFCLMPSDEKSYHLYEVNVDGSDFKQLTFGDYDDLDPIYLPDGKLLFNTTRANSYPFLQERLPDSIARRRTMVAVNTTTSTHSIFRRLRARRADPLALRSLVLRAM